jgi:hypothetical protein
MLGASLEVQGTSQGKTMEATQGALEICNSGEAPWLHCYCSSSHPGPRSMVLRESDVIGRHVEMPSL